MTLLSVVIPVYNEKDTIVRVIQRVEQARLPEGFSREIIIVNDGSTDGTGETLALLEGRHTVVHQKNTGKGGAVHAGLRLAKGDYVVIQDADLEQDPDNFAAMLEPIHEERADAVFGSRFLGQYLPASILMNMTYIANRVFTLSYSLFTRHVTTDMLTGYKMFSRKALDAILPHITSKGFEIEPELAILLSKTGMRITDVPISYAPRRYAEGKKISWKHAAHLYIKMIVFAFRKIN